MGTYELDDDLVRRFVNSQEYPDEIGQLRAKLRSQLSIPVPTKIGAVVRTTQSEHEQAIHPTDGVFLRWAADSRTHSPWIEASNHEQPYRTDEIGRIVEVLAPGVDL